MCDTCKNEVATIAMKELDDISPIELALWHKQY